ncbi:MAG: D-tyrosyl-tRNA(Tyr) deacylase [Turicibacter sp.]|nr:D-tyrosyl-tRNA(Tyr) deacylase [Turicibacter sp.]
MRVMVQRAKEAKVTVNGQVTGEIDYGLLLLVGITHTDTVKDLEYCAKKVAQLRIFNDEQGKMNLSIKDVKGAILSVSQFTLYGETKKGNRPSYIEAARPEVAKPLYAQFNQLLRERYHLQVETGVFGEMMDVSFTNDGPITLMIES